MITKLSASIKEAMKAKDKARLTTLRGLMSEAKNIAINDKRKEINNEDLLSALTKGIKQRNDSYESYVLGNRPDLADVEKSEIKILEEFQPKQLTEEQIISIVDDVIVSVGATTKKEMGKVMGALMKRIEKGTADNKLVSKIVGSKLN